MHHTNIAKLRSGWIFQIARYCFLSACLQIILRLTTIQKHLRLTGVQNNLLVGRRLQAI